MLKINFNIGLSSLPNCLGHICFAHSPYSALGLIPIISVYFNLTLATYFSTWPLGL